MKRKWHVDADEDLNEAFLEAAAIAYRLGGAFSIVTHRDQIAENTFVPAGASFLWDSFAPANRVQDEPEEHSDVADIEPEPEPVEIP